MDWVANVGRVSHTYFSILITIEEQWNRTLFFQLTLFFLPSSLCLSRTLCVEQSTYIQTEQQRKIYLIYLQQTHVGTVCSRTISLVSICKFSVTWSFFSFNFNQVMFFNIYNIRLTTNSNVMLWYWGYVTPTATSHKTGVTSHLKAIALARQRN